MREYLKSQIKNLPTTIILFIMLYSLTTFATNYLFNANEVQYDNGLTGMNASDVNSAIDILYAAANTFTTYNTRLKSIENKVGNDVLVTTAQNVTAGINEIKTSIGQIGTIVEGTVATTLTCANSTSTTIASMTLTKGTWIIFGNHEFSESFDYYYQDRLYNGSSAIAGAILRVSANAGGGGVITVPLKITSNSATINYKTIQYSGSTRTAKYVTLKAYRVA